MDSKKTIRADRNAIIHLAERGFLDAGQTQTALVRAGIIPGRATWKKFIMLLFLSLGTAFLLSGIVFFFAFNWHLIHKFIKLGGIAALIAISCAAGFIKGSDTMSGRMAWIAASALIGIFLAVFGQIYQTGADAWELFALWALLITGWTAASFFTPQRALFLVVAETAAALSMIQLGARPGAHIRASILLAAVNAILYLTVDHFHSRGVAWLGSAWFVRSAGTAALAAFIIPTAGYIVETARTADYDLFQGFAPILLILFCIALFFSLQRSHDRYLLSVALFTCIVYGSCVYIRAVGLDRGESFGTLVILGTLIIAQTAAAIFIITAADRSWSQKGAGDENA